MTFKTSATTLKHTGFIPYEKETDFNPVFDDKPGRVKKIAEEYFNKRAHSALSVPRADVYINDLGSVTDNDFDNDIDLAIFEPALAQSVYIEVGRTKEPLPSSTNWAEETYAYMPEYAEIDSRNSVILEEETDYDISTPAPHRRYSIADPLSQPIQKTGYERGSAEPAYEYEARLANSPVYESIDE